MILEKTAQWTMVGGLSKPGKLPGYSYSLPPHSCKVGAKLSKIPGTTCSKCYGKKGNYRYPCVKNAVNKRLEAIMNPEWGKSMTYLIAKQPVPHFRWHDVGDIQGMVHLTNIIGIADNLKGNFFWLPTQEKDVVRRFRKKRMEPDNVTIRFSSPEKINRVPRMNKTDCYSMAVSDFSHAPKGSYLCPSSKQGGKCLKCRACWNRKIKLVVYLQH